MRVPFKNWTEAGLGLFACLMIVLSVVGGVINYSPVPFWDMWDATFGFIVRIDDGDYGAWWSLHNEHRIVLARLLFWLDYKLFDGLSWFLIVVNYLLVLLIGLVFWLIAQGIARERGLHSQRLKISLLITAWLFLWTQFENFTWAFQSQFFLAQLLPLCAFYWLARSSRHSTSTDFFVACLFGVMSAGTMANGILALPLMFIYSLILRQGTAKSSLLLILSAATIVLYFTDYATPANHGNLTKELLRDPIGVLHYTMLYLGSPFYFLLDRTPAAKVICALTGTILTLTTILIAYREVWRSPKSNLNLALVFFLIYIGGTAFGTGGGRISLGLEQVLTSRYTTPALAAWAALFILLWANGLHNHFSRFPKFTACFVTVCCLALLHFQVSALENQVSRLAEQKVAALAISLGVRDAESIKRTYYNIDNSLRLGEIGKTRGYSIFGQYPYALLREDVNVRYETNDPGQCLGYLDEVTLIDGDSAYVKLHGWLHNPDSRSSPELIRFIDDESRVVGFALTGLPREDVAKAIGIRAKYSGFVGYLPAKLTGYDIIAVGDLPECQRRFHIPARKNFITVNQLTDSKTTSTIEIGRIVANSGFTGSDYHHSHYKNLGIYGSYINGDSDKGRIIVSARKGDRFYFRSGPTPGRQLITILGSEWQMILPVSTEWASITLTGKELPEEFQVEIADYGNAWGEWSAIGLLKH